MPDYLVFDVSDGRNLQTTTPAFVENAANENEAVASLLVDSYVYEQKFIVFKKSQGVKINVEQSRTVTQIDPKDGVTVLAEYDEAALEALRASRQV